jgi:hypothetical protein
MHLTVFVSKAGRSSSAKLTGTLSWKPNSSFNWCCTGCSLEQRNQSDAISRAVVTALEIPARVQVNTLDIPRLVQPQSQPAVRPQTVCALATFLNVVLPFLKTQSDQQTVREEKKLRMNATSCCRSLLAGPC